MNGLAVTRSCGDGSGGASSSRSESCRPLGDDLALDGRARRGHAHLRDAFAVANSSTSPNCTLVPGVAFELLDLNDLVDWRPWLLAARLLITLHRVHRPCSAPSRWPARRIKMRDGGACAQPQAGPNQEGAEIDAAAGRCQRKTESKSGSRRPNPPAGRPGDAGHAAGPQNETGQRKLAPAPHSFDEALAANGCQVRLARVRAPWVRTAPATWSARPALMHRDKRRWAPFICFKVARVNSPSYFRDPRKSGLFIMNYLAITRATTPTMLQARRLMLLLQHLKRETEAVLRARHPWRAGRLRPRASARGAAGRGVRHGIAG